MPMKNGIEWREQANGTKRYRGVINTKATGLRRGPWGSHAEAKSWRSKALGEVEAGTAVKSSALTLRDAWRDFIDGAEAGTVHDRTGKPFAPSTLRGYKRGWAKIEPELGAHRLTDIRRVDVQAMVDRWVKNGDDGGTISNRLDPLRTIYRRAIRRDLVAVNPTADLELPRVENGRERFATREEAAALLAALPDDERALWATAFYGGLRRSELRALRWSDVDLDGGLIHVQRAWDDEKGERGTKTKHANRRVPIVPALGKVLRAHREATGRGGADLVFGRTADKPFVPSTVRSRALRAWAKANAQLAEQLERDLADDEGLQPITLHECRHTFASLLIASGANAKALSVVMGHASITITFDRYGKLMPGGEAAVGELLAKHLDGDDG